MTDTGDGLVSTPLPPVGTEIEEFPLLLGAPVRVGDAVTLVGSGDTVVVPIDGFSLDTTIGTDVVAGLLEGTERGDWVWGDFVVGTGTGAAVGDFVGRFVVGGFVGTGTGAGVGDFVGRLVVGGFVGAGCGGLVGGGEGAGADVGGGPHHSVGGLSETLQAVEVIQA